MRIGGIIAALVGLLLLGGAARLVKIELDRGPQLRERAARQQHTEEIIPALRGEILDTRGRVLAGTRRAPAVFVDPAIVRDPAFAATSVAPVLGLSTSALEKTLRNPPRPRFVWVKRDISAAEEKAMRDLLANRRLDGFGIRYEPARIYPQGTLAANVLGFVGKDLLPATTTRPAYEDLRGLAGIESHFNAAMAGTPGKRAATVDVIRRRVRSDADRYVPPRDGATIVLTLDAYIQSVAEKLLAAAVEKHAAEWAVAVVMTPQSGEVLAMATVPSFDPTAPMPAGFADMTTVEQEAVKATWRNRAVSDSYEPGSIFKPIIASGALDDGLVQIDEVFAINGPTHNFGSRTIRDTHTHGRLELHRILSKSSNIGMGLVGERCGMERLHDYVRRFGFGAQTGIRLPGEHTGLVLPFDDWNPRFSPQSVAIGQEVAITPIQIATAYCALANGGKLMRPRIIRGLISPDGETLADYSEPVIVRQVLKPETAETIRRRALVEVVEEGTGKRAALDEYQVFGKSGTAQIAGPDGAGYLPKAYVGSFIGGAPADNPRVIVLVSIYKPSREGYYGGVVSAPVVRDIIGQTLAYMQVPTRVAASESTP